MTILHEQSTKRRGTETKLSPPTKVCAKQPIFNDSDNTLHALFHNQPHFFKAGQIVNALSEWHNKPQTPQYLSK